MDALACEECRCDAARSSATLAASDELQDGLMAPALEFC